jgi:predicted XRE-type DNA-binding protein
LTKAEIKILAIKADLKLSEIAAAWGMTKYSFSRKIRYGLNEADSKKLLEIVSRLTEERSK